MHRQPFDLHNIVYDRPVIDSRTIIILAQNSLTNESLLPAQGKPLSLKGEDRGYEAEYTDNSIIEVRKSEGSGWDPEVQRINDELLFCRRLSTVIKLSMAPGLTCDIGPGCAYAWRPFNLASRSTAELNFSSTAPCCKREISAAVRWALNAALIMLRVIPESQYRLAVLFTFCAFSGDSLMNLIVLAQTTAS